ncbi:glycosyltransferase [Zunongwangia profunda]|uniref:glycosyltransferase n=3 Tax=Zunongwangia profunda TaxID=398743 RepID=UPI001D18BF14|nr:glycosyltransferase [Zunongwangia profunda]MCC4230185.1 glycosyltransferase [Zunongwangia profunda]
MKFLVISSAPILLKQNRYFAYAPYARELNLWSKYIGEFSIVAPTVYHKKLILEEVQGEPVLVSVPPIVLDSLFNIVVSIFKIPIILFRLFNQMAVADHIHLRCPGNMGLLGCFLQIFFPSTPKTVKYAGNWDPYSKQPWSYKLQKWIISNTFLSRNIKVLVYGAWPNQTKNILPFFTASFSENDIESIRKDFSNGFKFLFVGSLVEGKQPLYAIRLVEELKNYGIDVSLKIFGEGLLEADLEYYIESNNLSDFIQICGGVSLKKLKSEYKKSHFSVLPSKSEGWPKAVAEAMFFGCIPIATKVSCVPWMLDNGDRGILLSERLDKDRNNIIEILNNIAQFRIMSRKAIKWSHNYTIEYFEKEIAKLL